MNAKQIKSFKEIRTKLLKVAQDELDITKQIPQGDSGPQEVVDAVAEVAKDLEDVIAMIPAEPQAGGEDINDGDDIPEMKVEDDMAVEPAMEDPEKKTMMARIAELSKKLDVQEKDKIANRIAQLYGDSEAKYDEIMASDKDAKYHAAQLETLEDFVKIAETQRKMQTAQDFSSYVKVAQQLGKSESRRKML